jgi:hypothetical protein
MYNTLTYTRWSAMKSRCYYKPHRNYRRYGGRGISVCERWRNSFEKFLADMGECPPGFSIERIDNDGNYEPGNCKWIPMKDQLDNTNQTRLLTAFGETMTFAKWARKVGIKRNTIEDRLRRGWSVERALSEKSHT